MKRSRWNWTRVGVAFGVGTLAVGAVASVGAAVSPAGKPGATGQYQPHKTMICHHTHSKKHPSVTIIVSKKALPAHLRHGDTLGPCPTVAATQLKAKKAHASHGKKKGHSKQETLTPAVAPTVEVTPAPGRSGTAPGHTGAAPGHAKSPAHGGTPPGHRTEAPSPPAPVVVATPSPPAPSTTPPGHGSTPPGHGGTPPGQGGTPPGQAGTPPGQGATPPGQSDKEQKK